MKKTHRRRNRDKWWNAIRTEIRSHAKALLCNAVFGYTESTTIEEEVVILSACGTACYVQDDYDKKERKEKKIEEQSLDKSMEKSEKRERKSERKDKKEKKRKKKLKKKCINKIYYFILYFFCKFNNL